MTDDKRPLKVFLCHASADKPKVHELYRYLKRRGLQPWLDIEDLLPGQAWQVEIPKALETSDAIIICLSKESVDKEGYVQKEIKFALDKALEMPEGRIFLIPARLEECDVPRSLSTYHWVDLFKDGGYEKLLLSLNARAEQLGKSAIRTSSADTIFIGHSQNDKDFPLWLSLQLISRGYSIWCDLVNSEAEQVTKEVARNVIKSNSIKYLYVLTNDSNQNVVALKELRFANDVMRDKRIEGFVIPLQVEAIVNSDLNILLQDSAQIDFTDGWAKGLSNLLDFLDRNNIPKYPELNADAAKDIWGAQFSADKGVEYKPEELLSNWFPIQLPEFIYFHELKRSGFGPIEITEVNLPFAGFQHNIYLVSFAPAADFDSKLGIGLSIKNSLSIPIVDFLSGNYNQRLINKELCWKAVSRLLNDAWERFFSQAKSVWMYRLANNQPCYYFKSGFSDKSDNKSFFTGVDGNRTWRSLVGSRLGKHWHFGIQGKVSLHPEPVYIVKTHVLFSDDGQNIWTSKDRLHSTRRSLCKNWWNVEWRDRLLASMAFFSGEDGFLHILVGINLFLLVPITPLSFSIPVSYVSVYDKTDVQVGEEQDVEEYNDMEYDEFDDEEMG